MDSNLIINRVKSIAWQFGYAVITFGLNWIIENLSTFGLPVWSLVMIAYFLNQVSKWWATKQSLLGKTFFGKTI